MRDSTRSVAWFKSIILALAVAVTSGNCQTRGSAAEKSDLDYPLVVFNVASFQRLRDNADLMFESAERVDMTDRVDQWTADTLKETRGIDRSRPFGIMTYLNTESFVTPMAIAYLPIENLEEALQTLAYGQGTVVPVDDATDRHEIRFSERFTLRTLYQNDYLFMVGPDAGESALDLNFPDPKKLTAKLSDQYDVAISCLIKTIPPGMKLLGLQAFKNQAIADLQQRDDEPESVYRLRRASGEGWIEMVDKIVNQGEEVTLGGRIDPETADANIDLEIAGTTDSKLAQLFQKMAGKRTYFGNMLSNPSTFTMSSSWLMDEQQRKLFAIYFESAQRDLVTFAKSDDGESLSKLLDPIMKTLLTTADVGHLDAFAQLIGTEPGEFVLLAGAKVATSRNLPTQITKLLEHLQDHTDTSDLILDLELESEAIDSFPVHRLAVDPPTKVGQQMFGKSPYLYIYPTPQAIWCAFGGDAALETLRQAVNSAALPQPPQQSRNRIPFLFVTHARNWLNLGNMEDPNVVSSIERAQASFQSDNDAMTLEIRPTERGVRLRLQFESGFLGLMGRGVTHRIENGNSRTPGKGPDQEPANPPQELQQPAN